MKYQEIFRRSTKSKIKKEKLQKEHLILEGGAYGHMNYPFDDNNLSLFQI